MRTNAETTSTEAQGIHHPAYRKRPAGERGRAEHGWLHARFTFSFAEYQDPRHMNFRSLRVMNNDVIEPGGGFPMHPHHDAEIMTYVMSGQLEHRDSMGNGAVIEAGNLQYMSAGSGVLHSEFNPSRDQATELYQVWLLPNQRGGEPRYAEMPLGEAAQQNALTLLLSPDGREGTPAIRQDAEVFFGRGQAGHSLTWPEAASRPHAWIQVISGALEVAGHRLDKADGLAIEHHPDAGKITVIEDAEFLLFRLS